MPAEVIDLLEPGPDVSPAEVGMKALNLIRMGGAGLRVPEGFVLPVAFFDAWLDQVACSSQWAAFVDASEVALEPACDALKQLAQGLGFDDAQRRALDERTRGYEAQALFAARSSSPEEDLGGSSFAGAYESVLGVNLATLEDAIRQVFASCFDLRLSVYKREHGFATQLPKIAVIVQAQIASEKAGVGFSINPLTNDHDEAVFNANWGQGETVVAGLASPDFYVVRKGTLECTQRLVGAKEVSIWLGPDGGVTQRRDPRHEQLCLSDEELVALTEELERIEAFFGGAVDIEWAFASGHLYLLQARPITTHHVLVDEMMTPRGAPKQLYLDITASVQGFFEPLSVLGASMLREMFAYCSAELIGARDSQALMMIKGGRIYLDLIVLIGFVGKPRAEQMLAQMDGLVSAAFSELDMSAYATGHVRRVPTLLRFGVRLHRRLPQVVRTLRRPEQARRRWERGWAGYQSELRALAAGEASLAGFVDAAFTKMAGFVFNETVEMFGSSKLAMSRIHGLFPSPTPELAEQLELLDQALSGNVTIEMGHALYQLHAELTPEQAPDADTLARAIEAGTLTQAFRSGWSAFMAAYGHRGVKELDICSPRYRDDPQLLLEQLVQFVSRGPSYSSPVAQHEAKQAARAAAFEALAATLSGWRRAQFARLYATVEQLGGFRETHKFVVIFTLDQIRARIVEVARSLVERGRLQQLEDVFSLSFEQLRAGLDLRVLVEQGRERQAIYGQCKQVFPLMDSRGRFHRPTPPAPGDGEFSGQAVSSGRVTGRIKVLHTPTEKPLLPGDILVARVTDPAWTTLFVNAAAIVLEIGGPLQHGALVAREYGKPCVAGIQGATELFSDGELVEVDGTTGIIRRLDESPPDDEARR